MESANANILGHAVNEPAEVLLLRTLAYFDVFRYPLREDELHINCPSPLITREEMQQSLDRLTKSGSVNCVDGFYFLGNDDEKVSRRIRGNIKAERYLRKARYYSKLISKFPFVEAVFISGSLSKGFIDTDGDIDYFIITRPGKLWLARTILIAFKKTVLFNSRKYFCVNYFVDSDNLSVPDHNIFTATELAYALPMYNSSLCESFFAANAWCRNYYPNRPLPKTEHVQKQRRSLLKRIAEPLFGKRFGQKAEVWCYRITQKHWEKKYKNKGSDFFELNIRSAHYISKYHPQGFQLKVLEKYNEKLRELGIAN